MPVAPAVTAGTALIDQAGTIPFRVDPVRGIELLLVTSKSGSRWVFPKGKVERARTAAEQAIIETYEEAGVLGDLLLPGVGRYVYAKNGCDHLVEVFLMQVDRVLDRWPESSVRHRSWLPLDAAMSIQGRSEARLICRDAATRLRELADRQLLYALGNVSLATPEGLSLLADRVAIGEAV